MILCYYAHMAALLFCCASDLLCFYATMPLCCYILVAMLLCCNAMLLYPPVLPRMCFTNTEAVYLCHELPGYCVVLCCVVVLNLALASIWYECMSVHYMIVHFIVAWCRTTVSAAMKPSWPLHRNLLTTTVLSQASNRLVHFATWIYCHHFQYTTSHRLFWRWRTLISYNNLEYHHARGIPPPPNMFVRTSEQAKLVKEVDSSFCSLFEV
jgi:hypothetical protein